tara:strand:- start:633 stop:1373 length:741 start_codon:yes stop_codon:yes gene_type:complete
MENNLIIKLANIQKIYDLGKFDAKYFLRKFMSKKKFTTLTALENITLNIEKNERVALLGDNGAGKSTLLKIISKITIPNKGSIEVNGVVCSLLEAGVGFHPELNGIENIFLKGTILGMTRNEIQKKIEKISIFSEIDRELLKTPVKRYSTGMTLKLALAIILNLDAQILIMDEIMAVVDNDFKKKCIKEISSLVEQKQRTLLFVSHQLDTVKELCKRGILIDNGKIIMDDNIDKVLNYYNSISKSK